MFPVLRTILSFVREDLRRLPILRCLVPFAIGIVASRNVETSLFDIAAGTIVSAALLLLYVICRKQNQGRTWAWASNVAIMLSFIALGLSYCQIRRGSVIEESGEAVVVGYVREVVKDNGEQMRLCIHADSIEVGGKKYMNVDGIVKCEKNESEIVAGREISGEIKLWPVGQRFYSDFDYETWLLGNDYGFVGSVDTINSGSETRWTIQTAVSKLRMVVSARLSASGLSGKNLGLVMALLMGDKSRLDNEMRLAFTDCGIVHILAVSGLHVGLIYYLLTLVLGRVREKKPWACSVLVMILLWLYSIICGMSPSVTRATIMMSVVEIGRMSGKIPDLLNSLYVSVFIILLINPMNIYSVGLYLSFMAVWGIATFYIPFRNRIGGCKWKIVRYVVDSALLSLVAQVSTTPVSLYCFHRFPLYFLVHNVLLIWMIAPIIGVSILAVICGGSIPLGTVVDYILTGFCEYASWASSWPNSVIENIPFGIAECFSLIILLYVVGWAIGERWVFWKVDRLRLTIVFCVFMVVMSCLALNVYYNGQSAVVAYDIYGRPTLHVVESGRCLHILSDTLDKGEVRFSEDIDHYYHINKSETHLMRDGMEIETAMGKIVIVDTEEKMKGAIDSESQILMITGGVVPCEGKYEKVLLSTNCIMNVEWMESGKGKSCVGISEQPWVFEHGWKEKIKGIVGGR